MNRTGTELFNNSTSTSYSQDDNNEEDYGSSDFEQESRSALVEDKDSTVGHDDQSVKKPVKNHNFSVRVSNSSTSIASSTSNEKKVYNPATRSPECYPRTDSMVITKHEVKTQQVNKSPSSKIPIANQQSDNKSDVRAIQNISCHISAVSPARVQTSNDSFTTVQSKTNIDLSDYLDSWSQSNVTDELSLGTLSFRSAPIQKDNHSRYQKQRKKVHDTSRSGDTITNFESEEKMSTISNADPFPLLADLKRTIQEIQTELPNTKDKGEATSTDHCKLFIEGVIVEARDLPYSRMIRGDTFVKVFHVTPGKCHLMSRSKKLIHQTNLALTSPHPCWNSYFSSDSFRKAKGDLLFAVYTSINNENYFIGQAQVKTSTFQNKITSNRRNIHNWFPLSSWNGERLERDAAILLKLDISSLDNLLPTSKLLAGNLIGFPRQRSNCWDDNKSNMIPRRSPHSTEDLMGAVRERHRVHRIAQRQRVKKRIDEENAKLKRRIEKAKAGKNRPISAPYTSGNSMSNSGFSITDDDTFLTYSGAESKGDNDYLTEKVKDASALLAAISGEVAELLKRY